MRIAKKCDLCGAFYTNYHIEYDSKNINGIATLNIDKKGCYFTHNVIDCCPECMESIKNHLESLRKTN